MKRPIVCSVMCRVLLLLLLGTGVEARAQKLAFIDQAVASASPPVRGEVLIEVAPGDVQRAAALVLPRQEEGEYLVGSAYQTSAPRLRFTVFLRGEQRSVAVTPVRTWSYERSGLEETRKQLKLLSALLSKRGEELSVVERDLGDLRERASRVAGIGEIVDLKMELNRLRGFGEQRAIERERLQRLVDAGRRNPAPPDIDERRQELSEDLRRTAQATAMADRLSSRRREAARMAVERKLALIKEMNRYDPQALAEEVLELRKQRKELESRLNLAAPEGEL